MELGIPVQKRLTKILPSIITTVIIGGSPESDAGKYVMIERVRTNLKRLIHLFEFGTNLNNYDNVANSWNNQ